MKLRAYATGTVGNMYKIIIKLKAYATEKIESI